MAQRVMLKRKEKAQEIFNHLGNTCTFEEFYEKFKELYPEDWKRIKANYNEEEEKTKKGKVHPMPHPTQYVKNLYNIYKDLS